MRRNLFLYVHNIVEVFVKRLTFIGKGVQIKQQILLYKIGRLYLANILTNVVYVLWVEIKHMVLFFSVIEIKSKVLHKVVKCSVEENLISVLKPVILQFFF